TTTSERTGRWTKMHRPFVPFSVPESSNHTRSLADCITTTFGFRFSVQTTVGKTERKDYPPPETCIAGREPPSDRDPRRLEPYPVRGGRAFHLRVSPVVPQFKRRLLPFGQLPLYCGIDVRPQFLRHVYLGNGHSLT